MSLQNTNWQARNIYSEAGCNLCRSSQWCYQNHERKLRA